MLTMKTAEAGRSTAAVHRRQAGDRFGTLKGRFSRLYPRRM